jgi:hypothetical protein
MGGTWSGSGGSSWRFEGLGRARSGTREPSAGLGLGGGFGQPRRCRSGLADARYLGPGVVGNVAVGVASQRLLRARLGSGGWGGSGRAWWVRPTASLSLRASGRAPIGPERWGVVERRRGSDIAALTACAPRIGSYLGREWPGAWWSVAVGVASQRLLRARLGWGAIWAGSGRERWSVAVGVASQRLLRARLGWGAVWAGSGGERRRGSDIAALTACAPRMGRLGWEW